MDRLRVFERQHRRAPAGLWHSSRRCRSGETAGSWRTIVRADRHPGRASANDCRRPHRPAPAETRRSASSRTCGSIGIRFASRPTLEMRHQGRPALGPVRAELRWRGFSAESTADGREPRLTITRVSPTSPWKVMPGLYTREGDVRELVASTDDMFVVSSRVTRSRCPSMRARCLRSPSARQDVPPVCGRIQQGDGPQLGESGSGRPPCRFMA